MVYRVYVEKKSGLDAEARSLKSDLTGLLQIKGLEKVRLLNRYDVENIDADLFEYCKKTVFSEPQLDIVTDALDNDDAKHMAEVEQALKEKREAAAVNA